MKNPANSLKEIYKIVQDVSRDCNRQFSSIRLLAATKQQPSHLIEVLLQNNHRLFGENKVQEAYSKWPELKKSYPDIELHLIGHLQTNKVKDAVALFDAIQTLDSFKLADKLVREEEKQKKHLTYYIEINIGQEPQKSGILPSEFGSFYTELKGQYPLNIQGIMCIPPAHQDPIPYFEQMQKIAQQYQIHNISMGMTDDFKLALIYGATLIRIGRALFR